MGSNKAREIRPDGFIVKYIVSFPRKWESIKPNLKNMDSRFHGNDKATRNFRENITNPHEILTVQQSGFSKNPL